ncbi:hypothetical protein HJG60_010890 [Phyllostomus discolor]|uniref:Uncharacterized protein n=1 Tax=Phyllostomus discolor TaxID=89673 RepID=A0A834AE45_9CHIR|nr:hypothetical protein HJG60_010890 [Phyllostomus discolor]
MGWLEGATGVQKKASFRSRQVNHVAVGESWLRRVYGFGMTGWRVMAASLTAHRSWTAGTHSCLAAIMGLSRCGPMSWSQSSLSSHAGTVTWGTCPTVTSWVAGSLFPSPWPRAWLQLFSISK